MNGTRIAEVAIQTREHLVEALKGLDEIIRLANEAGRDEVKKAAEAAKKPVQEAAKEFNKQVDEAGGNATRIDRIAMEEANEAATKGKKTCEQLLKELEKRVDQHDKEIDDLKKRVDQHDARLKENEAHLKEHDNMLGVAKNPAGAWMVVPGGNLHIVQQTATHLGYNRDNDGNVTFTDRNSGDSQPNWRLGLTVGAIIGAVFYIITGLAWGWTAMILPALGVTLLTGFAVAMLAPKGASNRNQPRG